jgi:hypothetical protein
MCLTLLVVVGRSLPAGTPTKRTPREALQPFNDLIGSWKGTGVPAGPGGRDRFWTETLRWGWRFKGPDAWLTVNFDKSPNFTWGEFRYLPNQDAYQLSLHTPTKEKEPLVFTGRLKEHLLTLERKDDKTNETHRLIFRLLHPERFLYSAEVKKSGKSFFTKLYQIGATKEGVAFAKGDGRPECIVSGGLGTIQVSYMGQTYYVCCSGCRTEFNADPAKYVREYNEKKAKKK